jgi:hypothetical protein
LKTPTSPSAAKRSQGLADVTADAKNLLNPHDGAFRRSVWIGAIATQFKIVRSLEPLGFDRLIEFRNGVRGERSSYRHIQFWP